MNRFVNKQVVKWTYDYSALDKSASFDAADINETADTITIADHPFETGDLVGLVLTPVTGVTATVPALSTAYYVIKTDKDTVQLATSKANAYAGTATALTAGSAADCLLVKNAFGTVETDIQIPAGAIITGGYIDVKTTFQSLDTIGGNVDAATLAFSSGVGAGDLFAATAISSGTTWDENSTYAVLAGVPALGANAADGDTAAELRTLIGASLIEVGTAAVVPTMAIAVDPLTAGKLDLYIEYIS